MLKSHNGIIEVCALNALSNANSPMGSNLSFLHSKYGINFQSHSLAHCIKVVTTIEQLDSQSNCLIEQLWLYYDIDVMNMLSVDLHMMKLQN